VSLLTCRTFSNTQNLWFSAFLTFWSPFCPHGSTEWQNRMVELTLIISYGDGWIKTPDSCFLGRITLRCTFYINSQRSSMGLSFSCPWKTCLITCPWLASFLLWLAFPGSVNYFPQICLKAVGNPNQDRNSGTKASSNLVCIKTCRYFGGKRETGTLGPDCWAPDYCHFNPQANWIP
jgi:hypothetical protein